MDFEVSSEINLYVHNHGRGLLEPEQNAGSYVQVTARGMWQKGFRGAHLQRTTYKVAVTAVFYVPLRRWLAECEGD